MNVLHILRPIFSKYQLDNKPLKNVEQCPPILLLHITCKLFKNAVLLMLFLISQSHISIFTVFSLLLP